VASIASTSTTDHYSHNPLYECLVCSRQVSSNRYAPHLAKCLGLGPNSSSKTSSSRKGKASDTNAAALAFSRGQKVASALENRKKAMGMSNGSSARNSPNRDSDDASNEASAKRKTLADSLGLNKNGKRSGSPVLGVGTGNWKRNKNKTATPPPSSLKDSDPNSSLSVGSGMARSLSANSQLPLNASSQPFSHSPLNPNKYNNSKSSDANDPKFGIAGSQENVSPSKPGSLNEADGQSEILGRSKDEDMEDYVDSPAPSSGSGLILKVGKRKRRAGKEVSRRNVAESQLRPNFCHPQTNDHALPRLSLSHFLTYQGESDEDSSILSNSNSFSSGEASSGSEAEEGSSEADDSSDEDGADDDEMDYDSALENSGARGKLANTYSSKKKVGGGGGIVDCE